MFFLMLFVLILLSAFFAASETAFVALSKINVRQMIKERRYNARLIEKLKNLEAEKTRKKILVGRINLLISNLIDKDTLITEFDPRLFSHVVEKVVVTQKEMRFVYFAGYENVVVIH